MPTLSRGNIVRRMNESHPVAELREHLALSQQALGEKIGRSRSYINQVESGAEPIGKDTVLLLLDHFRKPLDELGITTEDLLRGERATGKKRSVRR